MSDDDVFDLGSEHEQVVFCNDPLTGLRAIVAIHSTALGPALGGTRFYPYASTSEALVDVLNLSRGMSYKAALAGLDLGGGKAVIIGDPHTLKSEALLRAYGRFVQSLHGRYLTACDVGTYSEDMDHIARECSYVTGRTVAHGGAGDSSVLTAYGVFQGMRAAAQTVWGEPTLAGRTVGIAGVGKVGYHLTQHLIEDGAKVVVTDVYAPAVERVRAEFPQVAVVGSTDALVASALDACGHREGALGPGRALRTGLLRQLRRSDPGRRRARGVLVRTRQAPRYGDLRHHARGVRPGELRRRTAGRRRGPARRTPDA